MSETKDENIKLVESEQAETKDDEKKVETGYYFFFQNWSLSRDQKIKMID